MQDITHDQDTFKTSFDHCILAGDITNDMSCGANDYFAFALEGSSQCTIDTDILICL